MKTKIKPGFVFCALLLGLFSSAVCATTLPSDLQFNVTFSHFKLSSNGSSWETIMASPTTIDLLASNVQSTEGASVTITVPSAGTYRYLGMGVTAITLSQPGQTTRDLFPVLKAQGGMDNWNTIVMEILPFQYTSGNLSLNMYMPSANFSGDSYATYFPENGPIFYFTGGTVTNEAVGTFNVTIPSAVDSGATVQVGAYSNIQKATGPSFMANLVNAGNGSASGQLSVPPGAWSLMAVAYTGSIGATGPGEGSKAYTVGGGLPWQGALPQTSVATGETSNVTLSYAFTITSSMGAGGGGTPPSGTSSITLTMQATPSAVTLASDAQLLLYSFTSEAGMQAGVPPTFFMGAINIAAGNFSGQSYTTTNLAAGNYLLVAFLDRDGNGQPTTGIDYFGLYGGQLSPEVISLNAGQALTLSNPIQLSLFQ